MSRERTPLLPWVLGLGGLVPFLVFTLAARLAPAPFDSVSATGFHVYAAVILSFLGGTRWGFELNARPDFPLWPVLVFSNLPPLLAWFGVMLQLTRPEIGLALLAAGFAAMWLWDVQSSGAGQRRLPVWYPKLRTTLSLVVLACCAGLFAITSGLI